MRTSFAVLAVTTALVCDSMSEAQPKDMRPDVRKIADQYKDGKVAAAEQSAKQVANSIGDVFDVMELLHARKRRGLGWGRTPLRRENEDALENRIQKFAKPGVYPIEAEMPAVEEAGYDLAAVAEVLRNLRPAGKNNANWDVFTKSMQQASFDLALGANEKVGIRVNNAAAKLNRLCTECHNSYRR